MFLEEDPSVPYFAEVVQSTAHQMEKIRALLDHIESKYHRPPEFTWTAERNIIRFYLIYYYVAYTSIRNPFERFCSHCSIACHFDFAFR